MQPQINTYNQLQLFKENEAEIQSKISHLKKSIDQGELLRKLIDYSEKLYNRNLKIFDDKNFSHVDFVTEVVLKGFDTEEQAMQILRNRIINYKRVLIAKAQAENDTRFEIKSKICRKCQLPKDIKHFQVKKDKATGFKYYNNLCDECERARRRKSYADSETQKKSNRERQARWRRNQKLNKTN